jgi:hypothetical protein
MTDIWNYHSKDWTSDQDLVGYDVEATDGSIGKIDESTAEAGRQHIVVDTGFWIFGKKRLIPAGTMKQISHDEEKVFVSMTKDQIKEAPDFDETRRGLASVVATVRWPVSGILWVRAPGDHPSVRPTRGCPHHPKALRTNGPFVSSARPCSGWGLPSRRRHRRRWCALTAPFHPHL